MLCSNLLLHGTYRDALIGELVSAGLADRRHFVRRTSGYDGTPSKEWVPQLKSPLRPRVRELLLLHDKLIADTGYDTEPKHFPSVVNTDAFELYSLRQTPDIPLNDLKPLVVPRIDTKSIDVKRRKAELLEQGYSKKGLRVFGRNVLRPMLFDLAHGRDMFADPAMQRRTFLTVFGETTESFFNLYKTHVQLMTDDVAAVIGNAVVRNASIMSSDDPHFDKSTNTLIKTQIESYAILRIELSAAISELPRMESIMDALEIRKSESAALHDLRNHIRELTDIVASSGSAAAADTAVEKVRKVVTNLATARTTNTIAKWCTYIGVPISCAELAVGIPIGGIAIGIAGAAGQWYSNKLQNGSQWTTVVR
jgi:hypothetical protein